MGMEMGLWRAEDGRLTRIATSGVGLESQLEDYIESDPSILGERLLVVGRQVPTAFGGFVDLLAVDADGAVHVLELKRDKTPRDVVAQTLDYGSWVANLSRAEVVDLFQEYRPGDVAFEEAFAEAFGQAPPDELNSTQVLTIVAASVDPATERIVRYLNEGFALPINVVFFRHFEDHGRSYLARTWLVQNEQQPVAPSGTKVRKTRETWNGHDWYVSFGEEPGGRSWPDARRYGFISAGGGPWFSKTLKNLPLGGRVFACIPGSGYVGVGTVIGEATRFDEALIEVDGAAQRIADQPLEGYYRHPGDENDENSEYAVPIEWEVTRARDDAFWKPGMFANQNSACKLSNRFTIDEVSGAFGLTD